MKLCKPTDRLLLVGAMIVGGINAALAAFVSIVLQKIIDVATQKDWNGFTGFIPIMLVYLLGLGIMGFLEAYCGKLLIRNVSVHLREKIFRGVLSRNPVSYSSHNTADYLSALVNDVKLIEENYLVPFLLCSQMIVLFLTTLGILFYLSPVVTGILIFFLLLMFLVPILLGRILQKRQDAYSEQIALFTSKAKDFLNGYEVIRGYSMHSYIFTRYHKINRETARKKFSADSLMAVNECFSDILSSLSVIVIVFVSAYLMLIGHITMGTLLALIQLSSMFVTPVVMLTQNLPKISSMRPVWKHIETYMQETEAGELPQETLHLDSFSQNLTCSHVSFSYGEGQPVLQDLDLQIFPGKKYALLGDSGCGKSTLIKLLTGYSMDFQGAITYDGLSVKELPSYHLNRMVCVIYQNVFLFDADILQNICLGQTFSETELHTALEKSGVAQFLPSLEQGIHSQVGENGRNLSGGQKQKIALARALLRHTPILIIDEGTSAVDQQTAYEIEERLLREPGLTVLTITHHMNDQLIQYYDQILHMEGGKLSAIQPADKPLLIFSE